MGTLKRFTSSFKKKPKDLEETDPPLDKLAHLRSLLTEDTVFSLADTGSLLNPDDEEQLDALCWRFLNAESLNVERAYARLSEHTKWRSSYGDFFNPDTSILNQLADKKAFLQAPAPSSPSKTHPLLIIKASQHFTFSNVQPFAIYCLEAASRVCDMNAPGTKLVAVFDLKDLALKNLDAAGLRSCFAVLKDHFPERIQRIVMLDAPIIFYGLWKIVSPLIDSVSRAKVVFTYDVDDVRKEVGGGEVGHLPEERYGGKGKMVAVEVVVEEKILPFYNKMSCSIGGGGGGDE
jgi:hypothetical protein